MLLPSNPKNHGFNMCKAILAILPTLLLCGCGTCMNFNTEPTPYGGVRLDAGFISNLGPNQTKALDGDSQGWAVFLGVIGIVDLPFSAVADTLVLPVTVPAIIEKARSAAADGKD
jgi:uncharacterized protein YceK